MQIFVALAVPWLDYWFPTKNLVSITRNIKHLYNNRQCVRLNQSQRQSQRQSRRRSLTIERWQHQWPSDLIMISSLEDLRSVSPKGALMKFIWKFIQTRKREAIANNWSESDQIKRERVAKEGNCLSTNPRVHPIKSIHVIWLRVRSRVSFWDLLSNRAYNDRVVLTV